MFFILNAPANVKFIMTVFVTSSLP